LQSPKKDLLWVIVRGEHGEKILNMGQVREGVDLMWMKAHLAQAFPK